MNARFVTLAALAAALFLNPGRAGAQTPRPASSAVAYVSMQHILAEAADAKAAAKSLDALRQEKTRELTAKRQALEATRLELANSGGFFRASRREQLQAEVRKQEGELQQATSQAQSEIQALQQKLEGDLRRELSSVLVALAKARGIQWVFNQDAAILVAPDGADLTREALAELNARAAARAGKAKPEPGK